MLSAQQQASFSSGHGRPLLKTLVKVPAIGAKYGAPDKTVIAIIGDGGFQMTPQELGTIMQFGAAVKILILNMKSINDI